MENHIVEVKRPVGRPRLPKGDPATEAKRAAWRRSNRERYASHSMTDRMSRTRMDAEIERLFKEMGGKCEITGSTEDLEFHHIIPSQKAFNVTSYDHVGRCSYEMRLREAKKCVLITRREHTKIHSRVNAEIRRIKKETTLTKKGESGLRDYYTQKYTKQAILIAELKRM